MVNNSCLLFVNALFELTISRFLFNAAGFTLERMDNRNGVIDPSGISTHVALNGEIIGRAGFEVEQRKMKHLKKILVIPSVIPHSVQLFAKNAGF